MRINKIKIVTLLAVLVKHLKKGRTYIDVEITEESLAENTLYISATCIDKKDKQSESKNDTFDLDNINEII